MTNSNELRPIPGLAFPPASVLAQIEAIRAKAQPSTTCPNCKRPNALTAAEARKGYQCNRCANAEEGCF